VLRTRPAAPPPVIRPLAAVHFREALTAAQRQDLPAAVGALLAIDNESWQGIVGRLDSVGGTVADLLTRAVGEVW
jgi:hypothetical protein